MNREEAIKEYGVETIDKLDEIQTHIWPMLNGRGMYDCSAELDIGDDHWLTVIYELTAEVLNGSIDDLPDSVWNNPIYEVR